MSTSERNISYLERCEKWIDEEFNLTAEGIEAVIEQFGRKFNEVTGSNRELREDLKKTIDLLNSILKELTSEKGEGELGDEKELQSEMHHSSVDTYEFDPSSLTPESPAHPIHLTEEEKFVRLAAVLENSSISRGIRGVNHNPTGEARRDG